MAVRRPLGWAVCVLLLATFVSLAAPGVAGAQQCRGATPTYTDSCGPTFVVPAWGDAGGWRDPSKYSTIQLVDFNGDGKDELLARNDQGLEMYWFDTSVGQWRPQVDANGVPQALNDFRSPLPNETPATDWTKPEYYSTIQAADTDGQPGQEILGRFSDGMRVYKYTPPAGGNDVDGGTWARIGSGGPYRDADGYGDPSLYSTIQVGRFKQGGPATLFARQHVSGEFNDPGAQSRPSTLTFYRWDGQWERVPDQVSDSGWKGVFLWDDEICSDPSCYLTIQTSNLLPGRRAAADDIAEIMGRDKGGEDEGNGFVNVGGVLMFSMTPDGAWERSEQNLPVSEIPPFSDWTPPPRYPQNQDCPFSAGGATGAGSGDCLGSSPSYYETLQAADIDGQPGDEVLARASDGLRVRKWGPGGGLDAEVEILPTLTDLAGDAASVQPGAWGSIRTADIDGDRKEEVLAVTASGLQVWSYDPGSTSWRRWQPSTALALTGDWLTKPEYYATIQTGDVDGDGHDDVVARGPYGVRTWFYNRRGTGGWERYLPEGYPDFPGTPTTGQQGAFNKLNELALQTRAITAGKIRDVWTGAPDFKTLATTLETLQANLAGSLVGNCSNETSLAPPTYASCAPPADSSGLFTAGEWTAVVNEMISEAYYAEQVVGHFDALDTIRQGVFESQQGSLAAIGADLQLAGAAGNTTNFNLNGTFAATYGIAAALAALVPGGEAVSAALWVGSEVFSALPSASPTANSAFATTYDGLLDKVAAAGGEMDTALGSQRQQVLGDQAQLTLVAQLRNSDTWKIDTDGAISASRQAFVLTTYQALMPTVFTRYAITNCTSQPFANGTLDCELPTGPLVIGNSSRTGTWVGPPTNQPCKPVGYYDTDCNYAQDPGLVPDKVANIVWGRLAPPDICYYVPGNMGTSWHFGCPLGVPVATSIGADSPGWTFNTRTANPRLAYFSSGRGAVRATSGAVRASAAQSDSGARAAREVLGPLRFTGRTFVSRALRLGRMRVVVKRTLFEHGRREELARSRSGRRLKPFALRHVRGGLFTSERRGRPRVRLHLRRLGSRAGARLDLRLSRVRVRDVRALCGVLPASVNPAGRRLELETRLRLRDGGVKHAITMRQRWRCVRDRKGEFTAIRPIKPRRPATRPGLALRMQAPRVLASGRRATVLVTVANERRRRPSRVVSSLWDLRITATARGRPRTIGLKELRARRSRTLRLTVPVPRGSRRPVCVRVAATAPSARGASARRCARSAGAPPVTG